MDCLRRPAFDLATGREQTHRLESKPVASRCQPWVPRSGSRSTVVIPAAITALQRKTIPEPRPAIAPSRPISTTVTGDTQTVQKAVKCTRLLAWIPISDGWMCKLYQSYKIRLSGSTHHHRSASRVDRQAVRNQMTQINSSINSSTELVLCSNLSSKM